MCKREVCLSESGGKTQSVWWDDEVKAAVKRKETAWKEVLAASDKEAKERCMKAYIEEKRKIKKCTCKNKKKAY